jgi:hypothetical protein
VTYSFPPPFIDHITYSFPVPFISFPLPLIILISTHTHFLYHLLTYSFPLPFITHFLYHLLYSFPRILISLTIYWHTHFPYHLLTYSFPLPFITTIYYYHLLTYSFPLPFIVLISFTIYYSFPSPFIDYSLQRRIDLPLIPRSKNKITRHYVFGGGAYFMIFKRCQRSEILKYICSSIHINISIKVIIISKCCHSNLHTHSW